MAGEYLAKWGGGVGVGLSPGPGRSAGVVTASGTGLGADSDRCIASQPGDGLLSRRTDATGFPGQPDPQPVCARSACQGRLVGGGASSPTTAKGFRFITLEDELGMVNVVVRPRVVTQTKIWLFRPAFGLNDTRLLLVEGIVERNGTVVNLLAVEIRPLVF